MEIGGAELEKLADEFLEGVRRVASPSNIKKVVLEVGNLKDMVSYGGVVDELAKRLDEHLEYPILTRVRNGDRHIEGEYVINVCDYLEGGRRASCFACLGTLADESRKCNGKDE